MKSQDILSPEEVERINEDEDVCSVCELHKRAYDEIPDKVQCPICHTYQENFSYLKDYFTVVGEANFYEPTHNISKIITFKCEHCGETIGLFPEKIIYNANHDIHYTGGRCYLTKPIPGIKDAIMSDVENFTMRLKNGEDSIEACNLVFWIEAKIEHKVAEYLF